MGNEVERFITWVRMRNPQTRTWRDYRCDLELIMNVLGIKNIEEIRPRDIDEFVNFQIGKGYKPSTVNRRLAAPPCQDHKKEILLANKATILKVAVCY